MLQTFCKIYTIMLLGIIMKYLSQELFMFCASFLYAYQQHN